MKHFSLTFTFVLFTVLATFADGIIFVHDYNEALTKARAENKLIFIDCYTTWCGPCKMLSAQTFPQKQVGDLFNDKFINLKIDCEKGNGPDLCRKFGVSAYPTLLWIDADENVIHKAMGYRTADILINDANKVLKPDPAKLADLKSKFDAGTRDASFLYNYLDVLSSAHEPLNDVFSEYLSKVSSDSLLQGRHAKLIYKLSNNINSPGLDFMMANQEVFSKGEFKWEDKLNTIAAAAVEDAAATGNKAQFEKAGKLVAKLPNGKEKQAELSVRYFMKAKDWPNFIKTTEKFLKKYHAEDAMMYDRMAWNCYNNCDDTTTLNKAISWALTATKIKDTYAYNAHYAYLLNKAGRKSDALVAAQYAESIAVKEGIPAKEATKLIKELKKELGIQ